MRSNRLAVIFTTLLCLSSSVHASALTERELESFETAVNQLHWLANPIATEFTDKCANVINLLRIYPKIKVNESDKAKALNKKYNALKKYLKSNPTLVRGLAHDCKDGVGYVMYQFFVDERRKITNSTIKPKIFYSYVYKMAECEILKTFLGNSEYLNPSFQQDDSVPSDFLLYTCGKLSLSSVIKVNTHVSFGENTDFIAASIDGENSKFSFEDKKFQISKKTISALDTSQKNHLTNWLSKLRECQKTLNYESICKSGELNFLISAGGGDDTSNAFIKTLSKKFENFSELKTTLYNFDREIMGFKEALKNEIKSTDALIKVSHGNGVDEPLYFGGSQTIRKIGKKSSEKDGITKKCKKPIDIKITLIENSSSFLEKYNLPFLIVKGSDLAQWVLDRSDPQRPFLFSHGSCHSAVNSNKFIEDLSVLIANVSKNLQPPCLIDYSGIEKHYIYAGNSTGTIETEIIDGLIQGASLEGIAKKAESTNDFDSTGGEVSPRYDQFLNSLQKRADQLINTFEYQVKEVQ